jgi:hypothetical protein
MKSLKDYITESEQWMETPAEGDNFALELEDDTLLETYIMEVAEDGSLLLDSNEQIYSLLENWNLLSDDIDGEEDSIVTDSTCIDERTEPTTIKNKEEYLAKRKALQSIQMDPSLSRNQKLKVELMKRRAELERAAKLLGINEDSARRLLASDSEGALGYKVYLDRDWGEYVVKFYVNGRYQPEEDYHTDDKNDAMSTAQQFLSNDRFDVDEAEYQGRDVPLNKPMRGDVAKSKVYVRDPKTGNVKKVNFGDPNMKIKKSNPDRRRSFRARHNCDNPGPKTKARYWSCKAW